MPESVSSKVVNKLTQLAIAKFMSQGVEPGKRWRKISDGGSLFLVSYPSGMAVWRFKYKWDGKERAYVLGRYPGVSLAEARIQREAIREQVKNGKDPVMARRVRRLTAVQEADHSFQDAYRLWLDKKRQEWSGSHYRISVRAFERDVLPALGRIPVTEITPAHVAVVVKAIAGRGAIETAHKILQHIHGIFRNAQGWGWCLHNPADPVGETLPRPKIKGRIPAILEFEGLGDILRRAEAARLSPAVRLAHRLCAFSTARMGNVTLAEWQEFHLDEEIPAWVIPRSKMKARDRHHDHKIILCDAIVAELLEWRGVSGGEGWVFPTPTRQRGEIKPISREAVEKAYRETLGLKDKHTPHGWRAAFSTLAKDNGFSRDAVELALDHIHDNDVVRAYDRGERMTERIKLMTWWGEQLCQAQKGADLLAFPKERAA